MTDTSALAGPVGAPSLERPPVSPPDPGPRATVAAAVAVAVDTVAGARRTSGTGVEVATQYRGGKTVGVRLSDEGVEVHVVAERPGVARLADEIHVAARSALDGLGDRRPVGVFIDDLDVAALSGRGA
jgi:hypothetical protein